MSATSKPRRVTTEQTITQIEQRVQQRWFDLIQAEDAGQGDDILTDLFARYMADLEMLAAARAPAARRVTRPLSQPNTMLSA